MQPTDPNKFTESVWNAIILTTHIAKEYRHQNIESEHLMKALLEQKKGLATSLFYKLGIDIEQMGEHIENFVCSQPKISNNSGNVYLGRGLDQLLDQADNYRRQYRDDYISVEHILLSYFHDIRFGRALFAKFKLNEENLKNVIDLVREHTSLSQLYSSGGYITQHTAARSRDNIIGRDNEIFCLIRVLSRRMKNNPVLIGEPGAGKTSIITGFLQHINDGDVPKSLEKSRLISLDVNALITDTKSQNEVESNLNLVLEEVADSKEEAILLIDNFHTLIGSDRIYDPMIIGNLLRPVLMRKGLRFIITTTEDVYHKYIQGDIFLDRYFQEIRVSESSVEDTISIMRGLKDDYESYHGLKISEDSLIAAAELSDRYLRNRLLPGKAIDLIDEAAANLKVEMASKPRKLRTIDDEILQLEKKQIASLRNNDLDPEKSLDFIESEMENLKKKRSILNDFWKLEKGIFDEIHSLREEVSRTEIEVQKAELNYDLGRAAELKYGKLSELQEQLEAKERELSELQAKSKGDSLLRQELIEADIIELVSEQTDISLDIIRSNDPSVFEVQDRQIFISYSHKDKEWLEKLKTMLQPAIRQGGIEVWDDERIEAGDEWQTKIEKALEVARVAVLLVSSDFLASEFIYEKELTPLLKKAAEKKDIKIIWVYLSACLYEITKIPAYQAAHDISQPLNALSEPEQNKVMCDICNKIISTAVEASLHSGN